MAAYVSSGIVNAVIKLDANIQTNVDLKVEKGRVKRDEHLLLNE